MNRTHHAPHEVLARHQHAHGFAAVVLTGRYAEAGDTGCHRVEAGDVLIHRAFESHVDRFDDAGADVLVVPLPAGWNGPVLGRVADADAVARTAERNEGAVARLLASATTPRASPVQDWPDLLARALRDVAPEAAIVYTSGFAGDVVNQRGVVPAGLRATPASA